jgi:hypothetical protein
VLQKKRQGIVLPILSCMRASHNIYIERILPEYTSARLTGTLIKFLKFFSIPSLIPSLPELKRYSKFLLMFLFQCQRSLHQLQCNPVLGVISRYLRVEQTWCFTHPKHKENIKTMINMYVFVRLVGVYNISEMSKKMGIVENMKTLLHSLPTPFEAPNELVHCIWCDMGFMLDQLMTCK